METILYYKISLQEKQIIRNSVIEEIGKYLNYTEEGSFSIKITAKTDLEDENLSLINTSLSGSIVSSEIQINNIAPLSITADDGEEYLLDISTPAIAKQIINHLKK